VWARFPLWDPGFPPFGQSWTSTPFTCPRAGYLAYQAGYMAIKYQPVWARPVSDGAQRLFKG